MPSSRRLLASLLLVALVVSVTWTTIAVQHVSPRLGLDLSGGPQDPQYQDGRFGKVDCAAPTTVAAGAGAGAGAGGTVVLCAQGPDPEKLELGPVAVAGTDVRAARAELASAGPNGVTTDKWQVALTLSSAGAARFARITGELACKLPDDPARELAIVLDQEVIAHPSMERDVVCGAGISGGQALITTATGDEGEAKNLALLISGGALPLTLGLLSRSTVSATLGAHALRAVLVAGGLGLAGVYLQLLARYRMLGLVAWAGLAIAAALNVGIVLLMGRWIGFTLTLAGIAGLIVAIGISADSYIVFLERLKDELREGRTPRVAAQQGWARSLHTLVSANTVTLAAAIVLYLLAIGPVRGFAFTLGLATAVDFFSAWTFGWPVVALLARKLGPGSTVSIV